LTASLPLEVYLSDSLIIQRRFCSSAPRTLHLRTLTSRSTVLAAGGNLRIACLVSIFPEGITSLSTPHYPFLYPGLAKEGELISTSLLPSSIRRIIATLPEDDLQLLRRPTRFLDPDLVFLPTKHIRTLIPPVKTKLIVSPKSCKLASAWTLHAF
jgi:hypothetical protein